MPVTLEDMLARRTRSLFLDARASLRIAAACGRLMVKELGFSHMMERGTAERL